MVNAEIEGDREGVCVSVCERERRGANQQSDIKMRLGQQSLISDWCNKNKQKNQNKMSIKQPYVSRKKSISTSGPITQFFPPPSNGNARGSTAVTIPDRHTIKQ